MRHQVSEHFRRLLAQYGVATTLGPTELTFETNGRGATLEVVDLEARTRDHHALLRELTEAAHALLAEAVTAEEVDRGMTVRITELEAQVSGLHHEQRLHLVVIILLGLAMAAEAAVTLLLVLFLA